MLKKENSVKKLIALLLIPTAALATEYGTVRSSTPNYRTISVPVQTCQQVTQPQSNSTGINKGTVIGGVAGGIIGNQVGNGNGNTIATAVGAAVGAIVGQNIGNRDEYETRNYCSTTYEQRQDISSFSVTVDYKGVSVPALLNYSPVVGSQIPVRITVQ